MIYEFTQKDVQQDARIIERLENRIKELERQLSLAPIPDGANEICACGTTDCFISWHVEYDGAVLVVKAGDVEIMVELPENVRMCQFQ